MIFLFLDTYYNEGIKESIDAYNYFKDLILPSLSIAIPVLITLWITKVDRDNNAKNRKDDLDRYEKDKIEVLIIEKEKEKKHFETVNSFLILNSAEIQVEIENNLNFIKEYLDNYSFEKKFTVTKCFFNNHSLKIVDEFDKMKIYESNKDYLIDSIFHKKYVDYFNAIKFSIGIIQIIENEVNDFHDKYDSSRRTIDSIFQPFLEDFDLIVTGTDKNKYILFVDGGKIDEKLKQIMDEFLKPENTNSKLMYLNNLTKYIFDEAKSFGFTADDRIILHKYIAPLQIQLNLANALITSFVTNLDHLYHNLQSQSEKIKEFIDLLKSKINN